MVESTLAARLLAGTAKEVSQPTRSMPTTTGVVSPRIIARGPLGLGESYMRGEWDVPFLDQFMFEILSRSKASEFRTPWGRATLNWLRSRVLNPQRGLGAFNIGKKHYDLGNDLFEAMLDHTMTYTSGYWAKASSLSEAQEHKLELICRKLKLEPGMRVLDIGCGWGNFAKFAAKRYGVSVTGVTVSEEQAGFAQSACAGLPVDIRLQDYATLDEQFDHVVSIEMIEAVGKKNLHNYFQVVDRCLKPGGLFLVQAISADTFSRTSDPRLDHFVLWILKYIFPDGYLPDVTELTHPTQSGFVIEDWHSFGADYDRTLMAWACNFNRAWPELAEKYDVNFKRMWNFYLYSCAALFRARMVQLYQIVYSKGGLPQTYRSVRTV